MPRYYEVRCRVLTQGRSYIGLDFRFFSQNRIESQLRTIMANLNIVEDEYDINPKQRAGDKAEFFADCSGSYEGVNRDEKHTPEFLEFLTNVSNLAVEFLDNLGIMTCGHTESQEPRNEVSHLFRIMMGIQDGLDWDIVSDHEIEYPPFLNMAKRIGWVK